MFGIGSTELLVILVVALIVLGPKSIPQIAKTIGKVMGEFRRVSTEFQRTINVELEQEDHEKRKKEAEKELFGHEPAETGSGAPRAASDPASADTPPGDASPAPSAVDADSPLAQAVARAEAEAAAADANPGRRDG